jgi:hypothetical protein
VYSERLEEADAVLIILFCIDALHILITDHNLDGIIRLLYNILHCFLQSLAVNK